MTATKATAHTSRPVILYTLPLHHPFISCGPTQTPFALRPCAKTGAMIARLPPPVAFAGQVD